MPARAVGGKAPDRLRIGLVAAPWVPVPPTHYGGTEGVIDTLARGLHARGHDVTLFTVGDATCPVPRAWVYEHPMTPMGAVIPELFQVTSAYETLAGCDVVHDHTNAGPLWAGGRPGMPPVVATNHGEFTREARALYAAAARLGVAVVAISEDHRSRAGEAQVSAVIHHGLDTDRIRVGTGGGGYALFLGRFTVEKGAHLAIEIARRAGVPLRIAGKMREPDEKAYFEARIEPELGTDVVYLGEISPQERDRELAGSLALVNPIQWDEPFGLVMIESLACGTPVISFPRGAAPEIVRDGVTGFLVDDVQDAARALGEVSRIDRAACRADVEVRFSARRMVDDYLALYRRVIALGGAPVGPTTRRGHGVGPRPALAS